MSDGLRHVFGFIFRNPINIICLLGLAFCAFQAYVAKVSPFMYEMIMFGIVGVWVLLFLAKNFFRFILVLLVAGGVAYGWFYYTNRDKAACEAKGGFWNANTMTCEEKVPFLERLRKMFNNSEK